jgi:hypothetical protein
MKHKDTKAPREKALGISPAKVARGAIRKALPQAGNAPWMRYAGFVETGNPQSSHSIDDMVYGFKDCGTKTAARQRA